MRKEEDKETGQLMQDLGVLPRSSRAEELGLYPTCRVELHEAFHLRHCSDTCFKKIPLAEG